MNLVEAEKIAKDVVDAISGMCEKIEVAGAVRRRRPEVHDVDIVLIPGLLMWNNIVALVARRWNCVLEKKGDKLAVLQMPVGLEKCQIDLWVANRDNWGVVLLARTGSAKHNIKLASHAHTLGLQLKISMGVVDANGRVIASKTEEEVFKALGMSWIPPEKREG